MSLGDTLRRIGYMATFEKNLMKTRYWVTYSAILRKIRQRGTSCVLRRHSAKNWLDGDIWRKIDKKTLGDGI